MIWESGPWKDELRRFARTIKSEARRVVDIDEIDEARSFEIERALFYGAFVVRKLIENGKITDRVSGHSMQVTAFSSRRAKAGSILFAYSAACDLSKEYDLGEPSELRFSPSDLSSEVLHSHKLMWEFAETGRITGFFLCSYRNAEDRLLRVPLNTFVNMLNRLADDQVVRISSKSVVKPSHDGKGERASIKRTLK